MLQFCEIQEECEGSDMARQFIGANIFYFFWVHICQHFEVLEVKLAYKEMCKFDNFVWVS